jgi:hypothetical protein
MNGVVSVAALHNIFSSRSRFLGIALKVDTRNIFIKVSMVDSTLPCLSAYVYLLTGKMYISDYKTTLSSPQIALQSRFSSQKCRKGIKSRKWSRLLSEHEAV